MQHSRRNLVLAFGLLLTCVAWSARAEDDSESAGFADAPERHPPSVLVLMLDDAGYTDVGCYGGEIDTPQIDRLAAEGVRFTDCHAAAPNCSPARAGMLTGRSPTRTGVYSFLDRKGPMHLPASEVTVAELLKQRGYATGHFGKWHLSKLEPAGAHQPGPADQGFDVSFGTTNNAEPSHLDPTNFVRDGAPAGRQSGYSCDLVVDQFCDWLATVPAERPFFGAVWFHEPHAKIAAPPELVAKYRERGVSKPRAAYSACVENADAAIGRLLARLQESGRAANTLVFFTSDNGGLDAASNRGLRGQKSSVYEAGHRVPGVVRWPAGGVPAGRVDDTPVSHVDLLPTVAQLCGVPLPAARKLDGVSLVPLLRAGGGDIVRDTPLFWFFYRERPAAAMRDGDWAIVGFLDSSMPEPGFTLRARDMAALKTTALARFELYDLSDDLAQRHDVAAAHPEVLARLRTRMVELHREVVSEGPVWEFDRK